MTRSLRVLIVEDEPVIAETLAFALQTEGFQTEHAAFGRQGIERVREGNIDFVILDVGLPDVSGFEVCKEIRRFSDVPVLFLTARGEEIDRVVGLEIGGDDYVTKPFSPREVVARARVIARRGRADRLLTKNEATPAAKEDESKWFRVDTSRACIEYFGAPLELTRAEFMVLKGMLRTPGRVYSRAELMAFVSDEPGASLERTADAHVKTLRAKLRAANGQEDPIETHRGFGYSVKNPRREGRSGRDGA